MTKFVLLQCFLLFNSFEGIQDPKQDIKKKKKYNSVIKNGTFIATLLLYTGQFSIPTLYIYL